MLDFKKRTETQYITIEEKDCHKKDFAKLLKEARRQGEYDTGYHYIVDRHGVVTADRPIDAIAQYDFDVADKSIYILVDAPTEPQDAQIFACKKLLAALLDEYKDAEVRRISHDIGAFAMS